MPEMPPITDLPYRPCVGICLLNRFGKVWVGRRIPNNEEYDSDTLWQMPQGGIDPGEDPRVAVFREMWEETGVRNAEILGEIEDWLHYDFPPEVIALKRFRNRGQRQKWFALRFTGEDSEVDLTTHEEQEFDAWRWADIDELPDMAVGFKRHIYETVAETFGPLSRQLASGG